MSSGIFNPFVPDKNSPKREPPKELGDIRLDGDSYVLELKQITRDGVPERLGALIQTIMRTHRHILVRHGIDLRTEGGKHALEENEVGLQTPQGHICVYVPVVPNEKKHATEVKVFRRIACALREIPRNILETHNTRVIERM